MLNIFISYRRQDTSGYAVHLRHALPTYLTPGSRVFMDVDSIPPGVDFRAHIRDELQKCDALLVLIGDEWLVTRDKRERLSDETDHVRTEISEAIKRSGIPVIPILVERAAMPSANDLPPGLRDLAYRNAFEISDRSAEADVRRLGEHLAALDKETPTRAQPLPQKAPPPPRTAAQERASEGRIFADASVTGQELLAAHEAGTLEYRAIGRGRGGVNGEPYKNDLETGAWRTQPYKVSRLPEAAQQVNWFGMDRFIEDVTAAESATPPQAPAELDPPAPTKPAAKPASEGRIFADASVPGQELLAAHEAGTLEYRAIGRGRGGANGEPYKNDLETGAWRTQPYKVSRLPEAAQQVNWFGMDRFIEDVTAAESATPAQAPAAPDPPAPT